MLRHVNIALLVHKCRTSYKYEIRIFVCCYLDGHTRAAILYSPLQTIG